MSAELAEQPRLRSVVFFLVAVVTLSLAILIGQVVAWFMEQIAIESESLAFLGVAGKAWFVTQAVLLVVVCGIGSAVSRSVFRPFYQSWLWGTVVTLPGLVLRFLGPNQDQLGALLQIAIGTIGGVAMLRLHRRTAVASRTPVLLALTIAALGSWPFLLWGALGSGTDILLNLLAGLSFGLLAAALILQGSSGSIFRDGLATALLLSILGSAFGYDGAQLLLIAVLPAFGLAIRSLTDSVWATTLGVGLLAAAPLIFVDPTELSILLGDLFPWALRAVFLMLATGLALGLALWLLRRRTRSAPVISLLVPMFAWGLALGLYFAFGLKGMHGDRLFVILKDQADLSAASSMTDLGARRTFVFATLTRHADSTQAALRSALDGYGVHYKPYYLVNALEVDGGAVVRLYLLRRPEVDRVIPSPRLRPLPEAASPFTGNFTSVRSNTGWNIDMIGADRVWSDFGVTGEGVVIGQSDTGADGSHPALHDSFRGAATGGDYNWYDPWNGSTLPTDAGGHGTHTLGIILGRDGIGVAPGATWIGCVNLARNLGNPPLYLDCMQFMLAPFPHGGDPFKDGDPAQAADVLNNSWGCPPIEGCDAESLRPAADALRAAGIFVAVSTGNDGPACGTVTNPIALYDSVFSVGAVDSLGNVANFSSRGPVSVDGSNRTKPDIVAPGVDVFSSFPGGTYAAVSGTSMAGPHVAGVVALLWSADPALAGDIDRTEQILIDSARPYRGQRPPDECFSNSLPDDAFGYGIVDAYAAVKMALGK